MKPSSLQYHRIESTLHVQFPDLEIDKLFDDISITISRGTGRIRSISDGDVLLFSLRPQDGHFVPTLESARRILKTGYHKRLVIMNQEAAPFIADGKTAFCKHVEKVDPDIVPRSEVLVVDSNTELLAIGSSLQPAYAMLELKYGAAVNIRHGNENYAP